MNPQKLKARRLLVVFIAFTTTCFAAEAVNKSTKQVSREPSPEEAKEIEVHDLAMEGGRLTPKKARKLEAQVVANPTDLSSRTKLLGYYFLRQFESKSARNSRQKHVIWIIQNRPEAKIAGLPYAELNPFIDKSVYDEAKNQWLKQVEAHQDSTAILGNAAAFFFIIDKHTSEKLLKKAQSIEPNNPKWANELGHLHFLDTVGAELPEARRMAAAQALKYFEDSLAITTCEQDRVFTLRYTAEAAFVAEDMEKAKAYASEFLSKAKSNWDYGYAAHHGNIILGKIALKLGDPAVAKKHLIEAGRARFFFDPDMTLAEELLKIGEKLIVIEYLQVLQKSWKEGRGRLKDWTSMINRGELPDFDRRPSR